MLVRNSAKYTHHFLESWCYCGRKFTEAVAPKVVNTKAKINRNLNPTNCNLI